MPGQKMTVEDFQQFLMVLSAEVGRGASMEGNLHYSWADEPGHVVVQGVCRNGNDMGQGGVWMFQGDAEFLEETFEREEAAQRQEPPPPMMVLDMLLLVSAEVPGEVSLAHIESWTDEERKEVARWVGAVHLSASDNPVEVPAMPSVLSNLGGVDA